MSYRGFPTQEDYMLHLGGVYGLELEEVWSVFNSLPAEDEAVLKRALKARTTSRAASKKRTRNNRRRSLARAANRGREESSDE